jgi:hypothetical protein
MKSKSIIQLLLILIVTSLISSDLAAQCAMCKATAEAGIKEGQTTSAGLNTGILYLLVMPYLAFMVIGLLWWKNYKKRKAEDAELMS